MMATILKRHLWQSSSRCRSIIQESQKAHHREHFRHISQHSATDESSQPPLDTHGTTDFAEVNKFSQISEEWWTRGGTFQALHNLNELRVPLIRDATMEQRSRETSAEESSCPPTCNSKPLQGFQILDVGCGGGILSEPLARLGAEVIGLDASAENIEIAKQHADSDPSLPKTLAYTCCSVENMVAENVERFDTVVASEILEHVANPSQFVEACCRLVKPNGSLIFTTLNKTFIAYALGIIAAENIARIVPRGAHDWNKFVPPSYLQDQLNQNGCHTMLLHGMTLNPVTLRWSWCRSTMINYALHAVKLPSDVT